MKMPTCSPGSDRMQQHEPGPFMPKRFLRGRLSKFIRSASPTCSLSITRRIRLIGLNPNSEQNDRINNHAWFPWRTAG